MIIVKAKQNAELYWGDSACLALGVVSYDNHKLYVLKVTGRTGVSPVPEDELVFLDSRAPTEWIKRTHGENDALEYYSFPEWADDENFMAISLTITIRIDQ